MDFGEVVHPLGKDCEEKGCVVKKMMFMNQNKKKAREKNEKISEYHFLIALKARRKLQAVKEKIENSCKSRSSCKALTRNLLGACVLNDKRLIALYTYPVLCIIESLPQYLFI